MVLLEELAAEAVAGVVLAAAFVSLVEVVSDPAVPVPAEVEAFVEVEVLFAVVPESVAAVPVEALVDVEVVAVPAADFAGVEDELVADEAAPVVEPVAPVVPDDGETEVVAVLSADAAKAFASAAAARVGHPTSAAQMPTVAAMSCTLRER
jgi:hypothetical protein